jgi:hypothetical protein
LDGSNTAYERLEPLTPGKNSTGKYTAAQIMVPEIKVHMCKISRTK